MSSKVFVSILSLSALAFGVGCESLREEVEQRLNRTVEVVEKEHELDIALPNGLLLDKQHDIDTSRNLEIDFHLPLGDSGEYAQINTKVRESFQKDYEKFLVKVDTALANHPAMKEWQPSEYWIIPYHIYDDGDNVSYCYHVRENISGVAQPVDRVQCIVIEKGTGKKRSLSHFLNVGKDSEKDSLLSILNSRIDTLEGKIENLDSVVFGLVNNGVVFYLDQVMVGPGEKVPRQVVLGRAGLGAIWRKRDREK